MPFNEALLGPEEAASGFDESLLGPEEDDSKETKIAALRAELSTVRGERSDADVRIGALSDYVVNPLAQIPSFTLGIPARLLHAAGLAPASMIPQQGESIIPPAWIKAALDAPGAVNNPLLGTPTEPIGEGVKEGVSELGSSLAAPENLPFLSVGAIRPALRALVGAGFSGLMTSQIPQAAADLGEATVTGTPQEVAKSATMLAGTGAMATLPLAHSLASRGRPEVPFVEGGIKPAEALTPDAQPKPVEPDARRAERAEGVRPGPMLSPLPPVPTVAPKALSQVIRDLSTGLKTPIRFGRLLTRKFGGYFMPKPNLIASKFANDIVVTSHEVGHRLDDLFKLRGETTIRTELEHLGDNTRPGSMSSWTKSKTKDYRRGEGVAEFIRYWLTDKAEAQRLAPTMFAHFENVLGTHTDLANVLNQAREDIRLWRTAEPQARLRSQISTGDNPSKTSYTLSQLTSDLLDDLHYMRLATDDVVKLGDPALKPSENPYLLARNLRGAYGMADTFIRRGQIDFKTKEVTGKGLEQVLKPVGPRINDFVDYIVSRQAREMRAQGKETGLVPADVDFVFNKFQGDAEFNAAFNELKQWSDSFIKYSVDAGYLSSDAAAAMRSMNQEYVPFHRVFEVGAGEFGTEAGTGRGLNAVGQAFKGRKGSRRDIVNPLETYVKNAYAIITNSEKNAINVALADLSHHTGMGKWVEKVGTPKEGERVGIEKLREQLEDAGADLTGVPDDLLLTFWKDSKHAPSGENIIKVNRAGKLEFYRLNRDLFRTVSSLDAEHAGTLIKLLSQPSQVLRAGATLTPDFAISNVLRDTVNAAVASRYGMFPVENTVRGLYALLKNPKLVQEWKASGGAQSVEAHYFDRPALQRFLKERISKDFSYADYAKYVAKSPLSAIRILSGTLEQATRIGEFQIVVNKLLKQGYEIGEARRLAAFESRDLQDFAMGGSKTKSLRRMTAFWNAAVQGEYRLVRSLKDPKTRWMTMAKGFAWVTVPSITAFMLNKDDPDYWDRPQWERDVFWLIPRGKDETGHTKFLRIPKPFTVGLIFGTMPERIMSRWFKEDPEAFKGLGTTIGQNVPNPVPQSVMTLFGAFGSGEQGYDTFRRRKIVPDSMADFPPDLQFTEQTSLTAKKAGKLIGISPMKVDYIINQTTGGLGRQTVNQGLDRVISWMTGEPRTARAAYPMGRFLGTPSGVQSQAVDDFYNELDRLRNEKAREKQTGEGDSSGLRMMERQAERISKLRKSQREEKDELERQKISLQIREIAELALGRESKFDESLLGPVE